MTKQQFWMVKGAGPANAIHPSKQSAEQEALRLARQNPGQRFYVLEAVTMHRKVDVESIDLRAVADPDFDEMPF